MCVCVCVPSVCVCVLSVCALCVLSVCVLCVLVLCVGGGGNFTMQATKGFEVLKPAAAFTLLAIVGAVSFVEK